MKINKIYINAFGGLKKFELDLNDGLNVIFGENENGKTTVMTFIRCMFYGTGGKKQSLNESIREKYTPWDGSAMGGRIFFSSKGTEYCLEREFRKSDSTDRITLINKDTGEELPAGNNIGEEFFGLTAKAFERSVFIDNNVFFESDSTAESDFNAKLSNVSSSGDTDVSEEKVLKRITSARNKVCSVTGKAGTLAADRARLKELSSLLIRFENDAEKRYSLVERTEELESRLSDLTSEYEKTKKITDSENDVKNARKLKDFLQIKDELDTLNREISAKDGSVLNQSFINACVLGTENYEKHSQRASMLSEEIETTKRMLEEINNKTPEESKLEYESLEKRSKELEERRNGITNEISAKTDELHEAENRSDLCKSKKPFNLPLFIIGILLLIGAAVVYFAAKNLYIVSSCAAAGIILLLLGFILKPANKKKIEAENDIEKIKKELENLKDEKTAVSEEKAECLSKLSLMSSSIETQKALAEQKSSEIAEKQRLLESENSAAKKAKDELIKYFGKYKNVSTVEEIKSEMTKLSEKNEALKELKTKLTVISKDIDNISYEEASEKLVRIENGESGKEENFEAQKEKLGHLTEKITETKERIAALQTELKTGFRDFVSPETVKREINDLKETVSAKESFCAAADIAAEVIAESAQSMRKTYGNTLESDVLKIFSALTGGKYGSVLLGKGFELKAEETDSFGMHDINYMSKGTVTGAYLSLRLAISSLLSKSEPLPVMLDDALSQFDDARLKNAIEFLSEYAKDNQIVLFTCHGNICDMAKESGSITVKPF